MSIWDEIFPSFCLNWKFAQLDRTRSRLLIKYELGVSNEAPIFFVLVYIYKNYSLQDTSWNTSFVK